MIGSVSGGNTASPAQFLNQIFKRLDSNSDGSIDQADLALASKNRDSQAPASVDPKKAFGQIDTNSDGKITESEFVSFANALRQKGSGAKGAGPAGEGGPRGMPPGGGRRTSALSSTSSTGSTGKTYDPKDTNRDGVVSPQEEALYDSMHPDLGNGSASTISNPVTSYDSSGNGTSQTSPSILDIFA
jgi:hypothetical protein